MVFFKRTFLLIKYKNIWKKKNKSYGQFANII